MLYSDKIDIEIDTHYEIERRSHVSEHRLIEQSGVIKLHPDSMTFTQREDGYYDVTAITKAVNEDGKLITVRIKTVSDSVPYVPLNVIKVDFLPLYTIEILEN